MTRVMQYEQSGHDAASSETELQLGRKVEQPKSPSVALLDFVKNPIKEQYVVRLVCSEFTSLCPVTGQPDFATIVIDYIPSDKLVESKSLKLFLASFRNYGAFHEACVGMIAHRLRDEGGFSWVRVKGYFVPRGGIAIQPTVELAADDADYFDLLAIPELPAKWPE